MKKVLALLAVFLLAATNLYAGNGDLIVNGKLGVGTTTPGNKLDVNGGINAQAFNSDNGNFIVGPVGGSARIWTRNTSPLAFLVNDGEVMRITDGKVGIGTTEPQGFRLFVNGDFKVEGYSYTKYGNWAGSDIRFKKDILPLEGSLDKVLKLSGVSYEWVEKDDKKDGLLESTNTEELGNKIEVKNKDFSEGRHFGVIAQDIEKVIPEAVKEDNDGYKAVNYAEIIPVLIEAMKEQQKQISNQQKEIEQLKEKVAQSSK